MIRAKGSLANSPSLQVADVMEESAAEAEKQQALAQAAQSKMLEMEGRVKLVKELEKEVDHFREASEKNEKKANELNNKYIEDQRKIDELEKELAQVKENQGQLVSAKDAATRNLKEAIHKYSSLEEEVENLSHLNKRLTSPRDLPSREVQTDLSGELDPDGHFAHSQLVEMWVSPQSLLGRNESKQGCIEDKDAFGGSSESLSLHRSSSTRRPYPRSFTRTNTTDPYSSDDEAREVFGRSKTLKPFGKQASVLGTGQTEEMRSKLDSLIKRLDTRLTAYGVQPTGHIEQIRRDGTHHNEETDSSDEDEDDEGDDGFESAGDSDSDDEPEKKRRGNQARRAVVNEEKSSRLGMPASRNNSFLSAKSYMSSAPNSRHPMHSPQQPSELTSITSPRSPPPTDPRHTRTCTRNPIRSHAIRRTCSQDALHPQLPKGGSASQVLIPLSTGSVGSSTMLSASLSITLTPKDMQGVSKTITQHPHPLATDESSSSVSSSSSRGAHRVRSSSSPTLFDEHSSTGAHCSCKDILPDEPPYRRPGPHYQSAELSFSFDEPNLTRGAAGVSGAPATSPSPSPAPVAQRAAYRMRARSCVKGDGTHSVEMSGDVSPRRSSMVCTIKTQRHPSASPLGSDNGLTLLRSISNINSSSGMPNEERERRIASLERKRRYIDQQRAALANAQIPADQRPPLSPILHAAACRSVRKPSLIQSESFSFMRGASNPCIPSAEELHAQTAKVLHKRGSSSALAQQLRQESGAGLGGDEGTGERWLARSASISSTTSADVLSKAQQVLCRAETVVLNRQGSGASMLNRAPSLIVRRSSGVMGVEGTGDHNKPESVSSVDDLGVVNVGPTRTAFSERIYDCNVSLLSLQTQPPRLEAPEEFRLPVPVVNPPIKLVPLSFNCGTPSSAHTICVSPPRDKSEGGEGGSHESLEGEDEGDEDREMALDMIRGP
eukprot:GHVN01035657.1.p1 GENE.GHVN01035657.1~~GHVN01035657.1.p1  ORF type:complete len:948 (+),score=164.75 GHVN01035657.1:218-3061(+)